MDRRQFMTGLAASVLPFASARAQQPRSVVLIMVDDLFSVEHYRTKFGVPIYTPNFDALMARGISFMNAFASTALCNPSRTSILTGLNPFKTGVHYGYDLWETFVPAEKTLFAMLKSAGWSTYAIGKIFHSIDLNVLPVGQYLDQAYSAQWSADADTADPQNIPVAIQRIKHLPTTPYFMALGITDPHLPFISQQEFLDLYPLNQIVIPDWTGDQPPNWILPYLRTTTLNNYTQNGTLDEYVQGYLANISEMDSSLGRLVNNLAVWANDPIIILSSDHGFTLGDHDHLGKFTLWDEAARAPLIVVDPDCGRANVQVTDVVSLLDIMPTILDYAGLPIPADLDGWSLRPLIYDPLARRTIGAMTSMMGSARIRRNGHSYARYEDGAEELFVPGEDPEARFNVADDPEWAPILDNMRGHFDTRLAAWKGAAPQCHVQLTTPPAAITFRDIC